MAKPQFDPAKLMLTWVSNIPLGPRGCARRNRWTRFIFGVERLLHGDRCDSFPVTEAIWLDDFERQNNDRDYA